jgi:hypothetical protein
MEDDDLIAELCLMYFRGITGRKSSDIDSLYKEYDKEFEEKEELNRVIRDTFDFIKNSLTEVFDSCPIERYNFYSLFGALMYNKYGFRNLSGVNEECIVNNRFCNDVNATSEELIRLFSAASNKDLSDPDYSAFVIASRETTHSKKNRVARFEFIYRALNK